MSDAPLHLDGHKLFYHPDRVADFMAGRTVWPLYAEISPTSICNHRCLFCNFNHLGHAAKSLPQGRLPDLVKELGDIGVKGLVLAGSGEPSLHPDTFPALRQAAKIHLDAAMSTNGAVLREEQLAMMAELLVWVRFSINGGDPDSYATCQNTSPQDFEKALTNLQRLAHHRDRIGSQLTIGSQCVLLPENRNSIASLARRLKECGADYFSVKHFYASDDNAFRPDMSFLTPSFVAELQGIARDVSDNHFTMIVRGTDKLDPARPYTKCLGLPFIIYIRENGQLYTCFSHQDDEKTAIGSVLESDGKTLWTSDGKTAAIDHLNNCYDKNHCQVNCRHHQINLFLHQMQHPPAHVNFI